MRLAGLSSGAKLDLVFSSRSPSVVSLALQLPEPDAQGSNRLTDKFASDTTLWMVLRKFESNAEGAKRNFTGRGVPRPENHGSGAGRLFFETPVIQVMGRELSSFTDLQKTLAQLGYNSGSALLRLTFRTTETPLEEAMQEIGQYFGDIETQNTEIRAAGSDTIATAESIKDMNKPLVAPDISNSHSTQDPMSHHPHTPSEALNSTSDKITPENTPQEQKIKAPENGNPHRPVTVFAPSSSNTPRAASQAFNEKDYEPTIDHAKLHQSRLASTGTNKRLLSDAELAHQAEAQAQKYSNAKEVEIKVRFPDQMQTISKFSNLDNANTLYNFVRGLMARENEPFSLQFSSASGPRSMPSGAHGEIKLISGLGMVGRVLVNVVWEEGVSAEARGSSVLKEQYRQQAREIEVKEIEGTTVEDKPPSLTKNTSKEEKERKGGVPKWLKLPGKK